MTTVLATVTVNCISQKTYWEAIEGGETHGNVLNKYLSEAGIAGGPVPRLYLGTVVPLSPPNVTLWAILGSGDETGILPSAGKRKE
jgi:hypothetical protein